MIEFEIEEKKSKIFTTQEVCEIIINLWHRNDKYFDDIEELLNWITDNKDKIINLFNKVD